MFATAAAGDTVVVLLFISFVLLSVAGVLFLNCCCSCYPLIFPGKWAATVTALQSGRSPHAEIQRPVPLERCRVLLRCCFFKLFRMDE